MSMIPVNAIYDYLEMMLRDEWGYIYGTAGEMWSEEKQRAYRDKWGEDDKTRGTSAKYGGKWAGHRVTDCSGVMVYIWNLYGLKIPHGSSSMVRNGYIVDCGPIPHPGWAALVDKTPDTPDNDHIGIVGADGMTVYEAKGTIAGFVTSKVTDPKWTKFGRFRDVIYEEGEDTVHEPYSATVNTESGNLNVRTGPGTNYQAIGKLAKGTPVTVQIDFDGLGWSYISDPIAGYVSTQYLARDAAPEPAQDDDAGADPDNPDTDGWFENQSIVSASGSIIILPGRWRFAED